MDCQRNWLVLIPPRSEPSGASLDGGHETISRVSGELRQILDRVGLLPIDNCREDTLVKPDDLLAFAPAEDDQKILVTIQAMPFATKLLGWHYAFSFLAIGPFLGTIAMLQLRRMPEAKVLAQGRR